MSKMSPHVAIDILIGQPSGIRDEARKAYLRSLSHEELFDWYEKTILALLLRSPKHAELVASMAIDAVQEVRAANQAATS